MTVAGYFLKSGDLTPTTATSIPRPPGGALWMTWVQHQLAHLLDHSDIDEPSGT